MPIHAYGLHWDPKDIDWSHGPGGTWRMPGRLGARRPNVQVVDMRHQQGIYILYGHHGAYYVGLARRQGIGERIKAHWLHDDHVGWWTNFSWFGFRYAYGRPDRYGFRPLKQLPNNTLGDSHESIADLEALLIKAMNLQNVRNMGFRSKHAAEWTQVPAHELARWLGKVAG